MVCAIDERNALTANSRHLVSGSTHHHIANGIGNNILNEEIFKRGHISSLCCSDEGLQQVLLLGWIRRVVPALGNVLTGSRDELARIHFFHLQDVRDLTVRVVESLTQNICRTFCGREFFKKDSNPKFECLASLRTQRGIALRIDKFRKARLDAGFTA